MRIRQTILRTALVLLAAGHAHAHSGYERIELGGRNGWDTVALVDGVTTEHGWQGGADLVLQDWRAERGPDTDLLVLFDGAIRDETMRYRTTTNGVELVTFERRFGAGSAAFNGESFITFEAGQDAMLAPGVQPGQFSVDLWINPVQVREGASVLTWRGALVNSGRPVLQELRLEIRDDRLVWILSNLILAPRPDGTRSFSSIELPARNGLIPQRWGHHQLRFDGSTGQLSYRIDGIPEHIVYLTRSGLESDHAQSIYFGADTGDGLVLGRGFHGFVDELRITRSSDVGPRSIAFSSERGTAVTRVMDLGVSGARLRDIDVRSELPGTTETRTWYRVGDVLASREARSALREPWVELTDASSLPGNTHGRYLQLLFELLPDATGTHSPRVQSATITFEPEQPPPTPIGFGGSPVPGGVELSWLGVQMRDIAGYRVFFGERPSRYTGTADVTSPIDIGNQTSLRLDGLQPDRSYVFIVESYDRFGVSSGPSREIQVRAGRLQP